MAPSTSKRILILEDETGLRNAYRIVLEAHKYTVFTAGDGEEGLEQLPKAQPDLILLDMLMPKLDGLGFMEAAHITSDYPQTKVIAFSNLSNSGRLAKLQQLGLYDHVLKADVNPAQLIAMVQKALAG